MAKKYHPDKNQGDVEAAEKFKQISDAYQILSDPDLRKRFFPKSVNKILDMILLVERERIHKVDSIILVYYLTHCLEEENL
jgi:hypothetical protein